MGGAVSTPHAGNLRSPTHRLAVGTSASQDGPSPSPASPSKKPSSPSTRKHKKERPHAQKTDEKGIQSANPTAEVKPRVASAPSPNASIAAEEVVNDATSCGEWKLPGPSDRGRSAYAYSQLQSFTNPTHENASHTAEAEKQNRSSIDAANLGSPASPNVKPAKQPDTHAYSYSAWTSQGETEAQGSPPTDVNSKGKRDPLHPSEADLSGDYAINLTSPMYFPQKSNTTVQRGTTSSPISGGVRAAVRPASAVASPQPPASSPTRRQTHPPPPRAPPLPSSLPASASLPVSTSYETQTAKEKKRTGKRKHRKHTAPQPRAAVARQPSNLGSILGPSPGLQERKSPPIAVSRQYSGSSLIRLSSPTPHPSISPSASPSFQSAKDSMLRSTAASPKEKHDTHLPPPLMAPTLTATASSKPTNTSPATSAFNSSTNGRAATSSATRHQQEEYGSFMVDYMATMSASARPPSPMTAVDVQPPTSVVASRTVNASPPLLTMQEDEDAQRRPAQTRRDSNKTAEDVLGSSLFLPSPPVASLSASEGRSPVNSATEVSLPYARNLRPRQWQYASMLQKKIGEKVLERKAKKPTPSPQQRKLSTVVATSRPPSRPAGRGIVRQLPRFTVRSTGGEEAPEANPTRLEASTEEDFYTSSYFFNFSSVLSDPAARAAATTVAAATSTTRFPEVQKVSAATLEPNLSAPASRWEVVEEHVTSPTKRRESPVKPRTNSSEVPRASHQAITAGEGGEEDMRQSLSRPSSFVYLDASIFTDNGQPLLAAHLSDFYCESLASISTASMASNSVTMEGSRDRLEVTPTVMVDGRVLLQGVGYAKKPVNVPTSPNNTRGIAAMPTKKVRLLSAEECQEADMAAMTAVGDRRPPPPPSRWSSAGENRAAAAVLARPALTAGTRHKMLRDQQRRLLREQQRYVRQLRNNNEAGGEATEASTSQPPMTPNRKAAASSPRRASKASAAPLGDEKQQRVPGPPPLPPSRKALANAFFAAEHSTLNLAHHGTTKEARPQPDIKYGPFVATDKSRFIDFEKVLGFGLRDVPLIDSPTWDSLPPPEVNEDSEEL